MHEKKAVKQFKKLTSIKPDQEWASATKARILCQGEEFSVWQQLHNALLMPLQKPVLVVAPLVLLAAVLGGMVVYFNVLPQFDNISVITTIVSQSQVPKQTLASLTELEASLAEVNEKLKTLDQAGDTSQVLSVAQAAEVSAQKGRELVGKMAKINGRQAKQVLASLSGGFDELEKKAVGIQKQRVSQLFQALEGDWLSQTDQALLDTAREYYEAGKYIDALLLLQRINKI